MPSATVTDVVATVVFWAAILPLAGYIFQTTCRVCGADPPSFRRAILVTILVGAAAFFLFDVLGYGIVRAGRDSTHLNLPPDYNYGNWLREPLYLKWQVMGLIPLLRWLPVLFAVCLAATAYVFLLAEPFRNCLAILAIQWTLNVVAMAVVSFVLSAVLRVVMPAPQPGADAAHSPVTQGSAVSPIPPQAREATRPRLRRGAPKPPSETAEKPNAAEGTSAEPANLHGAALAANEAASGSSTNPLRAQLQALNEHLSPYLEPIKTASAPYLKDMPAVQEFLDDGGWWLVLLALAVAAGFWLRALWRRVRRAVFGKSRHRRKRRSLDKDSAAVIDLDLVGDAFTDPGPQQIVVRGQTGRLRLVILAPSPSYVGDLMPEMAESLLDWLQPGLAEILESDKPRQVVWPRHPSLDRFVERFHQLVQIPEVRGRRSPWMLISGAAHLGRQSVYVGLAVFLDKTSYQREIQVAKEKWNEVLGLQKVTEEV